MTRGKKRKLAKMWKKKELDTRQITTGKQGHINEC